MPAPLVMVTVQHTVACDDPLGQRRAGDVTNTEGIVQLSVSPVKDDIQSTRIFSNKILRPADEKERFYWEEVNLRHQCYGSYTIIIVRENSV